ncbi:MAG: hypothetical protein HY738_18130 [Bacteroidia bacterium]|nr:hypothetical protein [Bacteroidia bacterium]
MVISEEDSLRYNQMRGKNMTGYFKDGNLYRIDVTGNGETVYYAKDDDGFIGVNKALGSYLRIILEDNEVSEIIFNTTPEGTMYPVNQLQPEELKLKGFIWLAKCRPANMKDIFN